MKSYEIHPYRIFSVKTGRIGTFAFRAALAKPSLSLHNILYWLSPNCASYTPPGAKPCIGRIVSHSLFLISPYQYLPLGQLLCTSVHSSRSAAKCFQNYFHPPHIEQKLVHYWVDHGLFQQEDSKRWTVCTEKNSTCPTAHTLPINTGRVWDTNTTKLIFAWFTS